MQNLLCINVFLLLWAQLFRENLGARRYAKKLEGIQVRVRGLSLEFRLKLELVFKVRMAVKIRL